MSMAQNVGKKLVTKFYSTNDLFLVISLATKDSTKDRPIGQRL